MVLVRKRSTERAGETLLSNAWTDDFERRLRILAGVPDMADHFRYRMIATSGNIGCDTCDYGAPEPYVVVTWQHAGSWYEKEFYDFGALISMLATAE